VYFRSVIVLGGAGDDVCLVACLRGLEVCLRNDSVRFFWGEYVCLKVSVFSPADIRFCALTKSDCAPLMS
jgi:hypothetical protein